MSVLKIAVDKDYYAPGDLIHVVCSLHNTELLLATKLEVVLVVSVELSNQVCTQGHGTEGYALPHGLQTNLSDATRLQTLVLWSSPNKIAGRALHPKPRTFVGVAVIPNDAVPSVLLASVGYDRAHISYSLRAELKTTSAFAPLRAMTPIAVVNPLPLPGPENPPLVLPIVPKDWSHFPLDIAATCNQTIYAIGSSITVNFTVTNLDRRDIKSLKISLIQRYNSFFISDLAKCDTLISETMTTIIPGHSSKTLSVLLNSEKASRVAPTTSYSFIQVEHAVVIQAFPAGLFTSTVPLAVEIPVVFVGPQQL
ncbi:expressed protein [Batrachochytrium dendrobatidis JAM81]|uniref:Expressed protein n=2 Tax=Batrachochytrium dendrobatidis TaxID=109871 RepID=F4P4A7_BATDJ|eukprot:XP_006679593.1 expressed protein [Batrachochytrium dendrobatidis JAM81]